MMASVSRIVPSSCPSMREAAKPAISGSRTSRNSAKCADPSCWLIRIIKSSDCRIACEVPLVTNVPRPEKASTSPFSRRVPLGRQLVAGFELASENRFLDLLHDLLVEPGCFYHPVHGLGSYGIDGFV